ncbi:MAG: peptide chain release factor N(5)-glutamine methyltransferase [Alphaproteobacteria bacterium]|nr:peptide chain release factor N(5)-glutamine methyltransferase [Alphaproteobacteria bacterium]
MTTVAVALRDARARLEAAGIDEAAREARLLLAHAIHETPARLVGWPERAIVPEEMARFDALVARRARREPVAYLVGAREFWGLSFRVTSATLIPRPDTETVVEAALAAMRGKVANSRVLDIGTGSGCLLIALLHELPDASGVGVDVSQAALAVARENAERLGVADRSQWIVGLDALDADAGFDLIVANLPYIPSADIATLALDVRAFEPRLALDGGADGMAIMREVTAALPRLLRPGGLALFEGGAGQAPELERLFAATAGLEPAGRWADLAGIERVTGARRRPPNPQISLGKPGLRA